MQVPSCDKCGGIIKPDLVFFGDNVPLALVDEIYALVDSCDTLLIIGSSLFVSITERRCLQVLVVYSAFLPIEKYFIFRTL